MPHSKREIGFIKKHMAYDLILKFNEETVYDRKKFIKSSLKVVLELLLDEEHGDVLDNVHHGLLEDRERVFDIIFSFLLKN